MSLLPGDTARPFPQVYVMQPPNPPIPPLQFLLVLSLLLLLRFCGVQPHHCFIHSWTSFAVLPFPETGSRMHYSPACAVASNTGVRGGTTRLHNCAFSNLITAHEGCRALLSTQEPVLEPSEEGGTRQIMEHQPALSDAAMRQPAPHFYSTEISWFSSRDPAGPLGFPVGMSLTCD